MLLLGLSVDWGLGLRFWGSRASGPRTASEIQGIEKHFRADEKSWKFCVLFKHAGLFCESACNAGASIGSIEIGICCGYIDPETWAPQAKDRAGHDPKP